MTATHSSYKTENQIIADCVSLANTALEYFGVDGWKVRQLRQLYKVNVIEPTIFVSVISYNQLGRQYVKRTLSDEVITRSNSEKHEVKIRFSALHRELDSDTTDTLSGVDVLKYIRSYMQSADGIAGLSGLGCVQYRAGTIGSQDFMNDGDNFQILPFFDVILLYTDVWAVDIDKITKVVQKDIYKI